MYDAVTVWGVYKLKECHLLDILDDEIRGTLGKSSDKADPTVNDRIKSTCTGRCQNHLSSQSIKAERWPFDSLPRQHEALPS